MERDDKCNGIVKATLKKCPYKGAHIHEGKHYCKRHLPKEEEEKKPPSLALSFPPPWDNRNLKKLQARIARGPSKSDEKGHIYIYHFPNDCYYYWKIGKTNKTVDERLGEWSKEHGVKVTLKRSFQTKYAKYTERLIHLYLEHIRVYRYPIEGEEKVLFKTVLAKSGLIVNDLHWERIEKEKEGKRMTIAKKKFTEWFMEEKIEKIIELIEMIIEAIP